MVEPPVVRGCLVAAVMEETRLRAGLGEPCRLTGVAQAAQEDLVDEEQAAKLVALK